MKGKILLTISSFIDGKATPVSVEAFATESPYLAVHRSDAIYHHDPPVCEMWTVTHIPTGLCVVNNAPSYGLAMVFASRIARFRSCDWSKTPPCKRTPKAVLNAEKTFDRILCQMQKLYEAFSEVKA